MPDHVTALIARYRQRGVLVDTNLFVLYLIGRLAPRQITSFKRTATYTEADFELLVRFVSAFEALTVTPHVLTEVSNLAGQLTGHLHQACFRLLQRLIPELDEQFPPASAVAKHPAFLQFGITDTAIAEVAHRERLVLTDDLPLYAYLGRTGVDVVNFNHLRMLTW